MKRISLRVEESQNITSVKGNDYKIMEIKETHSKD
jgi:hypothetical protein